MPRKHCCGIVDDEPRCGRFLPEQPSGGSAVVVGIEELEAVRLKDLIGCDQQACAAAMGLTRPTFQRILYAARRKIVAALVDGRPLIIKGGNYMLKNRVFECVKCGNVWEVAPCSEGGKHGYEIPCPKCGSLEKVKLGDNGERHMCAGHQGGCCGGHGHHGEH